MAHGRFDALRDDGDSSEEDNIVQNPSTVSQEHVNVPAYEDLSTSRADEETVLAAVYGDEFTREDGVWGCARLNVHCRPPDTDSVGCEMTLSILLGKQYPYVIPTIEMRNIKGLSLQETTELNEQLTERANELARSGSVMMIELVQIVEDFLVTHNRDPTLSAWEQMKAREAMEENARRLKQEEHEEMLRKLIQEQDSSVPESPSHDRMLSSIGGQVEKELARQVEALRQAEIRRQPLTSQDESSIHDEDEWDQDDEDNEPIVGSSRYQTDFVELGLLGRGGGGEVVMVRNRLDKRIYAVKKIILESEEGKYAKFGAVQNRKLRREVTTISRMTHKNIVRYYQAWVEGGDSPEHVEHVKNSQPVGIGKVESSSSSSEDDDNNDKGWWTSSPQMTSLLTREQNESAAKVSGRTLDSVDWSNNDDDDTSGSESSSSEVVKQEMDLDFKSPLMVGMGFQNGLYDGLFEKRKNSGKTDDGSEAEDDIWDESSVKVDESLGQRILYIQMEYCSTTLRKVIDDAIENPIKDTDKWRMTRQVVEALVYIHRRKLIHRDLKPGNIFLDSEGNIRLGDFGLATQHSSKASGGPTDEHSDEVSAIYSAIEDISSLLGGSLQHSGLTQTSCKDGLTGGVGTAFYRAPEQEGNTKRKGERYDVQADIFSLGIVIFELFHPPFDTYMERADILTRLRGQDPKSKSTAEEPFDPQNESANWEKITENRFPSRFIASAPKTVQKLILWCLQKDPSKRPTAEEILGSDLLPRKMELEQKYLEEALHTLSNPQSESYLQILEALFARKTSAIVDVTFDTDFAAKANNLGSANANDGSRRASPSEELMKAISTIRAGAIDLDSLRSIAMSASSLLSATAALRRAKHAGKIGKGGKGVMKRSTQRVAGILAMQAATAAAITGLADGVHGSDPRIVDSVTSRLREVFESHGAVHLRSPLLRPRPNHASTGYWTGPAELMSSRGTVVLLPEDLTASFARAVGRGGAATSNVKRYDIGRVYHKSLVGGHPRESLEASFDIIHEDRIVDSVNIEAESILVLCQSLSMIAPNTKEKINTPAKDGYPIWYLRISHSRLADSVLEICQVPTKESLRKLCLEVITELTSPTPTKTLVLAPRHLRSRSRSVSEGSGDGPKTSAEVLDAHMTRLIEKGLPRSSAQRLHMFLSSGCCPLSTSLDHAVDSIQRAVGNLRLLDATSNIDPRRLKRYYDIGRTTRHLKKLSEVLTTIGVIPHLHSNNQKQGLHFAAVPLISCPLYICFDLGLHQRQRQFSQLYFQALLLPPSMFHQPETLTNTDIGIKVAEGGRYDDLVRRNRPPGNFGSALFTFYTNASIPICVGVRFAVGRFVESMYIESTLSLSFATLDKDLNQKFISDPAGIEVLRKSLGHPLHASSSVQVIVASANGMDATSSNERLIVASYLWSNGISAEYLRHSGVMISLLQSRSKDEATVSDWSLEELCGVCSLLKIPYVVIVQPHLLRDKGSVRLRRIDGSSTNNIPEEFVPLQHLAATIRSGEDDMTLSAGKNHNVTIDNNHDIMSGSIATSRQQHASSAVVQCVYYVEMDQFWSGEKQVTKSDTPNYLSIKKALKRITKRSESYLDKMMIQSNNHSDPSSSRERPMVLAAELPFMCLRDFGTSFMRRCEIIGPTTAPSSLSGGGSSNSGKNGLTATATAVEETTERYPKYKRLLKTFGVAMDAMIRKYGGGGWKAGSNMKHVADLLTIFLYSELDDRFDMITVGHFAAITATSGGGGSGSSSSSMLESRDSDLEMSYNNYYSSSRRRIDRRR